MGVKGASRLFEGIHVPPAGVDNEEPSVLDETPYKSCDTEHLEKCILTFLRMVSLSAEEHKQNIFSGVRFEYRLYENSHFQKADGTAIHNKLLFISITT
jgi:hypothetical protein